MKVIKKVRKLENDPDKSLLANRITNLRIGNSKTQAQISALLGIAQTTYAGYETGRHEPNVQMLIKIAELYNVSIDYLVGRY